MKKTTPYACVKAVCCDTMKLQIHTERVRVMAMKVGVVGCGSISDIYLQNMIREFDNLEVVACCAAHLENAQKKAEQYGIRGCTYEQILEDPAIEMVVILTPAPTHYDLIRRGLEAGKHVYTEKTITIDLAQAKELEALAAEKGLYLGSAPDTFLGAALQKARRVIDSGELGDITGFHICANRCLDWLTTYFKFLRLPGGGICFDYGVYYLTALVSLLGPVAEVCATVENRKPTRIDCNPESEDFGKEFRYENEGQVNALIWTEGGVTGTFTLNGESLIADMAVFTIYGTKGVLKLTDPNGFGGDIKLVTVENWQFAERVVENELPYSGNSRGLGPAEMAAAISEGRPNRANARMAVHVLDIICAMMESGEKKCFVPVASTCDRPEPLL